MPGLRRLFDSRPDEEGAADAGHSAGKDRVHLGHRLLEPLSLLHEHLRHPLDSRPGAGRGHGAEASRPDLSVWVITGDGDGLSHRRQSPDALPSAATSTSTSCCSTTAFTA